MYACIVLLLIIAALIYVIHKRLCANDIWRKKVGGFSLCEITDAEFTQATQIQMMNSGDSNSLGNDYMAICVKGICDMDELLDFYRQAASSNFKYCVEYVAHNKSNHLLIFKTKHTYAQRPLNLSTALADDIKKEMQRCNLLVAAHAHATVYQNTSGSEVEYVIGKYVPSGIKNTVRTHLSLSEFDSKILREYYSDAVMDIIENNQPVLYDDAAINTTIKNNVQIKYNIDDFKHHMVMACQIMVKTDQNYKLQQVGDQQILKAACLFHDSGKQNYRNDYHPQESAQYFLEKMMEMQIMFPVKSILDELINTNINNICINSGDKSTRRADFCTSFVNKLFDLIHQSMFVQYQSIGTIAVLITAHHAAQAVMLIKDARFKQYAKLVNILADNDSAYWTCKNLSTNANIINQCAQADTHVARINGKDYRWQELQNDPGKLPQGYQTKTANQYRDDFLALV